MRKLIASSLLLPVLLTGVPPVAAHTLNPDVQGVEARLEHCPHDLFRARQADGTYLAEIAQERLLDFYVGLLEQALRRHFPAQGTTPPEARSATALQLLDDTLDLCYAHQIPMRLERRAKLTAYFDLLQAQWSPLALQRAIGARRVATPRGVVPGEIWGAALLSLVAADVHEQLSWGPQHLVGIADSLADPASWSLDGAPLTATQFQALVGDLASELESMNARQKVDLQGGHCLHFHPDLSGSGAVVAASETGDEDQQEAPPGSEDNPFRDVLDVIGSWWHGVWDVIWPGGGGPVDTGGGDGGDGQGEIGDGYDGEELPEEDPPILPNPLPPDCYFTASVCTNCPDTNSCAHCCTLKLGDAFNLCDTIGKLRPGAGKACKGGVTVHLRCLQECELVPDI